jgi:5-methyltetrahydrofolate--homocysteine methyltransferase
VLDGATGTLIQRYGLTEADFRGERFKNHPCDLRGDTDVLCLTRPDVVRAVHDAYLAAGADIISTDTFTATRIAQADYGLSDVAYEIHVAAARIARDAADAAETAEPGRPRFVAGSLGPTNKTASISPDVSDPAARSVTFEELAGCGGGGFRAPRPRPPDRRRGSTDDRNRLRRAEREGGDLRHPGRLRRARL